MTQLPDSLVVLPRTRAAADPALSVQSPTSSSDTPSAAQQTELDFLPSIVMPQAESQSLAPGIMTDGTQNWCTSPGKPRSWRLPMLLLTLLAGLAVICVSQSRLYAMYSLVHWNGSFSAEKKTPTIFIFKQV